MDIQSQNGNNLRIDNGNINTPFGKIKAFHQVKKLRKKGNPNETYAFVISSDVPEPNVFYNLNIRTKGKEKSTSWITKYEVSDADNFHDYNFSQITGRISYFDLKGDLIRTHKMDRGQIASDLNQRTEETCMLEWYAYGYSEVCTPYSCEQTNFWTEYNVDFQECSEGFDEPELDEPELDEPGIGGGGTPINSPSQPVEGIDCASFNFTTTSSNWQEAAVQYIRFQVVDSRSGKINIFMVNRAIWFGLPKSNHYGQTIHPGRAAEIAAQAVQYASDITKALYINNPNNTVPYHEAEALFMKHVKSWLQDYGGTADFYGTGSEKVTIRHAQFLANGNGNCY